MLSHPARRGSNNKEKVILPSNRPLFNVPSPTPRNNRGAAHPRPAIESAATMANCFYCMRDRRCTLEDVPDDACPVCGPSFEPHTLRDHLPGAQITCCRKCAALSPAAKAEMVAEHIGN